MKYANSGIPIIDAKFTKSYAWTLLEMMDDLAQNHSRYTLDENLGRYTVGLATIARKVRVSGEDSHLKSDLREVLLGRKMIECTLRDFIVRKSPKEGYVLPTVTLDAKKEAYRLLRSHKERFFTMISEENANLARMLIDVVDDYSMRAKSKDKDCRGRIISGGCIAYSLFEFQSRLNREHNLERFVMGS